MIRGQTRRIRGASFQMQRQLLCPPNHHHGGVPHLLLEGI